MINTIRISIIRCISLLFLLAPTYATSHEFGLQLYSLRHQMEADLPKAIAQIEQWGISAVEGGGNLYGYSIKQFKALLDKHKVRIVSVDTSYEELRDNPIAVAYKAKYYGAKFATIYWIPHQNPFAIDYAKDMVEILNTAGAVLKKNGITLQYHPHGYEFVPYKGSTAMHYMLENVSEAKFQMDVFWIKQAGQDPLELLKQYPNQFTSLHLKDRKKGSDNSSDGRADIETNVILGQGDVGIANIVDFAQKHNMQYLFLEDESSRVLTQVPKSLDYVQSLSH